MIIIKNVIDDCRLYLTRLGNTTIQCICKEANQLVDTLAKHGSKIQVFGLHLYYDILPSFVLFTYESNKKSYP